MKTWNIFESDDELVEHIDSELSNSDITIAHKPGELRVYFRLPTEHSRYGGLFVSIPVNSAELLAKLTEAQNSPGEVTLATRVAHPQEAKPE